LDYPLTWLDREIDLQGLRESFAVPKLIYDDVKHRAVAPDFFERVSLDNPHVPWDDFIVGDHEIAARMTTKAEILSTHGRQFLAGCPINADPPLLSTDQPWAIGSFWYRFLPENLITQSSWAMLMGENGYRYRVAISIDDPSLKKTPEIEEALCDAISALLGWSEIVAHGGLHIAEVTTAPRNIKKNTARLKPWLIRPPYYVAIDFNEATEKHGMPRGPVGERHAPTPHHRRGHYATLRAERYRDNIGKQVWRRPAWVGPTEWTHAGQIYKVINLEEK